MSQWLHFEVTSIQMRIQFDAAKIQKTRTRCIGISLMFLVPLACSEMLRGARHISSHYLTINGNVLPGVSDM